MPSEFDIEAVAVPDLRGHRVVIPGGTGGVGEGVVRTWLRSGANVIVPTRNMAKAAQLRELLGSDGHSEKLTFIEAEYSSFTEATRLADRITAEFGTVTDVVASIGGWWVGDGLWNVSSSDWHHYFLNLVKSHVAVVRAFVPRLSENGSYSLVLGGSAYTPVPGSSIISMEQAALRMMNSVVGLELTGDSITHSKNLSMHGLMMGPVATRQRSYVDPEMITADEVGYVTAAYAATTAVKSGEVRLANHTDVAHELSKIGYSPVPSPTTNESHLTSKTPSGWPKLGPELADRTVTSGDREYQLVRSNYMRVGHPTVVVMAQTENDVAAAITYAAEVREQTGERVPFSVRSGGHGISGQSTNDQGLVVDLSQLKRIQLIDTDSGLFQVQAGATWGEVAKALAPYDLAITSGNIGSTGVGGLATAGGVGYMARSQGLTLDHVQRVRLITADGSIRWVDENNEPELFWAVRGGATQAGIATDFVIKSPKLESSAGNASVISQELQYLIDDLPQFTAQWGDWMRQAPREAESFLMIQHAGQGRFVAQARTIWANDDAGAAAPTLKAALGLASVMQDNTETMPYPYVVPGSRGPKMGQQRIKMRDVLVDHSNAELGEAMRESLLHPSTLLGELRALGGAVSDVPSQATAWAGRHQEVLAATWINPDSLSEVDASFAPLERLGTGSYGAYSSDTRPAAAELSWPAETGRRLRAVADQVDPHRLFDQGLVLPAQP